MTFIDFKTVFINNIFTTNKLFFFFGRSFFSLLKYKIIRFIISSNKKKDLSMRKIKIFVFFKQIG